MKKFQINWILICYILVLSVSASISGKCLRLISSELLIRDIILKEIDYDEFRNVRLDKTKLDNIKEYTHNLLVVSNANENDLYIDEISYLTYAMLLSDYDILEGEVADERTYLRGISRVSKTKAFQELYYYYKAIFSDIKYFPVPLMGDGAQKISYEDSWCAPRTYGGNRSHEGTDIVACNNKRGYFPIISVTDGIIENMGWLEQGGYRIGIRSASGGYFYYAHLDSYAPELEEGDTVIAGQLLGFMGDTGYGPEPTIGKFHVHLHFGIYVFSGSEEISINPYWILKILEYSRTEIMY